ncbi:hypothetical protein [Bacillus sp. SD088]|nr:hypothetical protein [Bacillus sp. SD088]
MNKRNEPYISPKLVPLGSVLTLTRGGNTNGGDIGGQKPSN